MSCVSIPFVGQNKNNDKKIGRLDTLFVSSPVVSLLTCGGLFLNFT